MNYLLSVIRNDPWIFFGVMVGFTSVASAMTSGKDRARRWMANGVAVALAFGVTAAAGTFFQKVEAEAVKHFANASLEGAFEGKGGEVGVWKASPSRCLDGKERGFEGMLFTFEDAPVREIRLDTSRKRDNVITVHMDDDAETVLRVKESQCQAVNGTTRVTNATLNGRPMRRLVGDLQVSCRPFGLEGKVTFDGCVPETR